MGFIYCITSPSGKQYIGQTTRTVKQRWSDHTQRAAHVSTERSFPILCYAIKKYKKENFKVETLIECENKDLDLFEEKCIKMFNTLTPFGYNILAGSITCKASIENRQLLRDHHKKYRKIRCKPKRKYNEDDNLPMFVIHYKCKIDEGYRVFNHPTLPTRVFSSRKLTMEEKKQKALDYLKTAANND
jgi:hypothetical protein